MNNITETNVPSDNRITQISNGANSIFRNAADFSSGSFDTFERFVKHRTKVYRLFNSFSCLMLFTLLHSEIIIFASLTNSLMNHIHHTFSYSSLSPRVFKQMNQYPYRTNKNKILIQQFINQNSQPKIKQQRKYNYEKVDTANPRKTAKLFKPPKNMKIDHQIILNLRRSLLYEYPRIQSFSFTVSFR